MSSRVVHEHNNTHQTFTHITLKIQNGGSLFCRLWCYAKTEQYRVFFTAQIYADFYFSLTMGNISLMWWGLQFINSPSLNNTNSFKKLFSSFSLAFWESPVNLVLWFMKIMELLVGSQQQSFGHFLTQLWNLAQWLVRLKGIRVGMQKCQIHFPDMRKCFLLLAWVTLSLNILTVLCAMFLHYRDHFMFLWAV